MLRKSDHDCCPPVPHPMWPDIPAGLKQIPRQLDGFPQFRRAMLGAIPDFPALAGWRADSEADLGVMLFEAWAYILDITGFYDSIISNRSYLGTASDDAIAAEIVALTGYRPRPAMVASVRLAIEALGRDPVTVPAATGFRSQPFDDEKAQVFELAISAVAWPQRNRVALAPVRSDLFDGVMRFRPTEGPSVGMVLSVVSGGLRFAGRVVSSDVQSEADDERYRVVAMQPPLPVSFTGVTLESLKVEVLALTAMPSPLDGATAIDTTVAILDALYPMVTANTAAAIEINGVFHAVTLLTAVVHPHVQAIGSGGATATIPLSWITYASIGAVPANAAIRVHLVPKPVGSVIGLVNNRVTLDMIRSDGRLAARGFSLDEAPASGEAFALGQRHTGIFAPGTFNVTPVPNFAPDVGIDSGVTLETPVAVLGNVVTAVRGETVSNEVIGSGNAQNAVQRFKLKKKPLSWIEDAAANAGRSPQITVRVDGIAWSYTETLFGRGPSETVYTLEMAADGTATVICGDGVRGKRFPSGTANLVASYRFGSGAAKPPSGSITQMVKAVKGVSRVAQPDAAWGGADAESASEMRELAPVAALTSGRAVSLADFEAMVRSASGVVNASVNYSWDQDLQVAAVVAWIIADNGDPSDTLADYLAARALPGLTIKVALANRVNVPLFDVSVLVTEGFTAGQVRAAVGLALFDPETGFLAPRNVPIGAALFRSHLLAAIHLVAGVEAVEQVMLNSGPMPKAMLPGDGNWFDFLENGQVI